MTEFTDEEMRARLAASRGYTLALLRVVPGVDAAAHRAEIWEHGRRNFALRSAGIMPLVFRAADDSDWAGVGIFAAPPEEVERILAEDPTVKAGVFTYELHPVQSFPGDSLPA